MKRLGNQSSDMTKERNGSDFQRNYRIRKGLTQPSFSRSGLFVRGLTRFFWFSKRIVASNSDNAKFVVLSPSRSGKVLHIVHHKLFSYYWITEFILAFHFYLKSIFIRNKYSIYFNFYLNKFLFGSFFIWLHFLVI